MLDKPCRLLCLAFAVAVSAWSSKASVVLDDFNDAASSQRWTFWNGGEFPGATGSFRVISVDGSSCGRLQYDLNAGGEYVSAQREISPTLNVKGAVITLRVKQEPGVLLFLRVRDQSGQTLQYNAPRSIESTDPGRWSWTTVALESASEYWGGANTGVVNGAVNRITVGIRPIKFVDWGGKPVKSTKTGAVCIDQILLVGNSEPVTLTGTERAIAPTAGIPTLDSLGIAIHFADDLVKLQAAVQAGAKVVRTDLFWAWAESAKGQYNFAPWDKLVSSSTSRGLKVVLILAYGNRLYTAGSDKPPMTAEAIRAFGDFAEATARHFAGTGVAYEIWNEPDSQHFWSPVDPLAYAALLKAAAPRIARGDPAARVFSGGLAQADFPYLATLLETGALDQVSSVGVHPYDRTAPELQIDGLVFLEHLLSRRSTAPQSLSITECGVSSAWFGPGNDPEARKKQANLVLRQVLVHLGAGRPLDIVYDLLDDGNDPSNPEQNFGLYQSNLLTKPAAEAMTRFRHLAAGKSIEGLLDMDPRIHALAMKGANERTLFIWTELTQPVSVVIPATARVDNLYGQPVTIGSNGQIAVSGKPVAISVSTAR